MPPSEVVPGLIQQIYRVRPDLKLSKTAIHKILFKVRVTLPESDPDRKHLPFYWYNYGPIRRSSRPPSRPWKVGGILREERTPTGKSLLVLNKRPPDPFCVCEDASGIIGRIVRGFDPFRMGRVCPPDLPRLCAVRVHARYRVDFLVAFKGYCTSRPEGQLTLNRYLDEPATPDIDRLEDILYACEAVLVEEPLFEGFNDEFTAYVSGAGRAFDVAREDEAGAYLIVKATYASAEELWYTFARGVRIPDRGHDEYYNGRLGQWEQEYRESLLA